MSDLRIRRDRSFAVPARQETGKTEKTASSSSSQKAAPATGLNVSETLRQLMAKGSQAAGHARESRRTLQMGEAVLAEVQDSLSRMAELAKKAAGDGEIDRAALQAELDRLGRSIDRMMNSATVNGTQLFLDETLGMEDGMDALLFTVLGEAVYGADGEQAVPDWLLNGVLQNGLTPEQILLGLGLNKNASVSDLLAALEKNSLEANPAARRLAALYLGAIIASRGSGENMDPSKAADGLRQLFEKMAGGMSLDEAVKELTNGEFASLEDFQNQFTSGTAPGLQDFLTELLLTGEGPAIMPDASMVNLLAFFEGMTLDLMMDLPTGAPSAENAAGSSRADISVPVNVSPETAEPETAGANATGAAEIPTADSQQAATLQLGNVQVMGKDLSGVSFDAETGLLTISGTADVTVQGIGKGEQAILVTGSGMVTLDGVKVSTLTVSAAEASIASVGDNALAQVHLRAGVSLAIGGTGVLRLENLQADGDNTLRLTGGAVTLAGKNGGTPGILTVPVVLEGPVSLAAQAAHVTNSNGKPLEPMDIIWKTLLPGWSAITAMELNGKHVRMALMGGNYADLVRLWLDKGDPSHGHPIHTLLLEGKDAFGRPQTRYAYLHWNQQAGAFEEFSMYPNPFTITGGEQGRDWVYEEETRTLHILSNLVDTISGGSGTDANRAPFSGRIALADHIGTLELTLGGVVCRVEAGRAFSLGQENDVTLLLESGTDNRFESGVGCAGISLGDGTTLRIDCIKSDGPDGILTATGGMGGAGIGRDSGGSRDQASHILIRGGCIIATGTGGGAGIGAGKRGFMGPVTIMGGIVTSTGGKGGGAGIGGALGAPVGDITIRGGTVTAVAVNHAAAIGAGVQGKSGDILITGTARIAKAVGGNPGADIGGCLFGGCGKVLISGGADIGSARLWTRSGISLQMGEDIVTLPQFRLSARALQIHKLQVSTQAAARAAGVVINADQRWVSQIQSAYTALYHQLEESFLGLPGFHQDGEGTERPVRDTAAADDLLQNMRQFIPLQSAQAMRIHSKRGTENVWQLLW